MESDERIFLLRSLDRWDYLAIGSNLLRELPSKCFLKQDKGSSLGKTPGNRRPLPPEASSLNCTSNYAAPESCTSCFSFIELLYGIDPASGHMHNRWLDCWRKILKEITPFRKEGDILKRDFERTRIFLYLFIFDNNCQIEDVKCRRGQMNIKGRAGA